MSLDRVGRELLLRFIDGQVTPAERRRIEALLFARPAAREFLREVAEQAVMIADLEQAAAGRSWADREPVEIRKAPVRSFAFRRAPGKGRWRPATVGIALALLSIGIYSAVSTTTAGVARVSRVSGANLHFDASGRSDHALSGGTPLVAGDMIESRSCDSWVALDLGRGSVLTIAGHSSIRVLSSGADEKQFELLNGSLWFSSSRPRSRQRFVVQLPTATIEAGNTLMDVQTSVSESIVRVHRGTARVVRRLDGRIVEVSSGEQVNVSLEDKSPLVAIRQPRPVNAWSFRLREGDEVILGRWLSPTESVSSRLRAVPLLWPIPGRDPLLLHAVAVAAWKTSERPVRLEPGARLRFRGVVRRAQTVRFGLSTQKMRGVFAGKFEVDVPPEKLGSLSAPWTVELKLSDFRPLHPQLASSPDGLELTDVYALTIVEDAGLEIHHIELLPGDQKEERHRTR